MKMPIKLPTPIGAFFDAESQNDAQALGQAFAEDGVVLDEGHVIQGRPAIRHWLAETRKKYQHTVEPLESALEGDETIVICRLSGSFPGSPIKVRFIFKLDRNKITSLEVRS
jgi:ketosteroid isomerase-like protein